MNLKASLQQSPNHHHSYNNHKMGKLFGLYMHGKGISSYVERIINTLWGIFKLEIILKPY